MKVIVELDVFVDGMDEESYQEVKDTVTALIESGAESCAATAYVDDLHFKEHNVVMTKDRVQDLEDSEDTLMALETVGVDNWVGYSDAMKVKRGEEPDWY